MEKQVGPKTKHTLVQYVVYTYIYAAFHLEKRGPSQKEVKLFCGFKAKKRKAKLFFPKTPLVLCVVVYYTRLKNTTSYVVPRSILVCIFQYILGVVLQVLQGSHQILDVRYQNTQLVCTIYYYTIAKIFMRGIVSSFYYYMLKYKILHSTSRVGQL